MDTLIQDLRYGLRVLRASPGFAAAAVLTLALGMGATTAIFSVVNDVVLKPLPFEDPESLVVIRQRSLGAEASVFETSYPDFVDLREGTRSFSAMAAVPSNVWRHIWQEGGEVESVNAAGVSAELFSVLGVQPALGRAFVPEDDRIGAEDVVLLGNGLWRRKLGGDPGVLGRSLRLSGEAYRVVDVLPPELDYPAATELWTPLVPAVDSLAQNRQVGFLLLVGRLKPAVSLEAARADLDAVLSSISAEHRPPDFESRAELTPIREEIVGDTRPALLILLAAAGLVLLIACANVANLLLARGSGRREEIAVRRALGATRRRLARQLMGEGLLLAVAGAALGLWLGVVGVDLLMALSPPDLPRAESIGLDRVVLAFTVATCVLSALVFGALPAAQVSGAPAATGSGVGLVRSTEGWRGRRVVRGLVTAEVALAALVLVGAGLLVRSFAKLQAVDLGFDESRTLTAEVFLPDPEYAEPAAAAAFYDRLVERAEALPGVSRAAGVLVRPLEGPDGFDYPFMIEGRPPVEQAGYPLLNYEAVTAGYFEAMGIPLVSGRGFTKADAADAPGVVVVSRSVADRFWPARDAIGKRVKWGGPDSPAAWLTVVGVVGDVRYRGLRSTTLDVYVPHLQSPWKLNNPVVRSHGAPSGVAAAIRREIRRLDPDVLAVNVATGEELVASALSRPRFNTALLGLFGGIALALGAIGIYGVTAYSAARRTREMGIRMALGAEPGDVHRLVVGEALRASALGIVAGLVAAVLGARLMAGLVFGVGTLDPATLDAVPLFLIAVTVIASWIPSRRAARLSPTKALRQE